MKKTFMTLLLLATVIVAGAAVSKNLTFTSTDYTYHWVDEEGSAGYWYFGCPDESGLYMLRIAYNTKEQTGTVGYDDMNKDYSLLNYMNFDEEVYNDISFKEGSEVVISEDELCVYVTGSLMGNDGITYSVDAKCPKPQPQTYNIEGYRFSQAEYDKALRQWNIHFFDEATNWKVCLSLKSDDGSIGGTYTIADASEDGCHAEDMYEYTNYPFSEMNLTITLPEGVTDPAVGCEITGTAKDPDKNTFNFHIKKVAPLTPKETKTVNVDVSKAEWPSDRTGGSYFEVVEKNNPKNKWILSLIQKTGESTTEEYCGIDTVNTYRQNTETGKILHVNNGTISQTLDPENFKINVQAHLVMNDAVQYNFSFATPVSKVGEKVLRFTDLKVDSSFSEEGSTSLSASNDSVQISAQLTDYAAIPGEYADKNCQIGLDFYKAGEEFPTYVACNALIYANSTVDDDDNVTFKAKFLADDSIVYTVEATYVKPEPTETLTLNLSGCELTDNIAYGDGFCFSHESENHYIWIRCESDNKVEGHYTGENVNSNSYMELLNKYGMTKHYNISDADFTVTRKDTVYVLAGTCQAGPYMLNLTMRYKMDGFSYDDFSRNIDVTYAVEDSVELIPDDESSSLFVKFVNKSRNDELCLVLFPENYEYGMTSIPAATYSFAEWDWAPYAQAGMPSEEGVYASYYAQIDEEGNIQVPLWFLRSGSVVVDADGAFEVRATNSFGRTVRCVYKRATGISAIKTINSDSRDGKYLRNGKIIIRKNGIEYNALGQRR